MPTAADLRRLADELEKASEGSKRVSKLLTAAEEGIPRAIWRDGRLSVWTDTYMRGDPDVSISCGIPSEVASFLQESAAGLVDQAATLLENAPEKYQRGSEHKDLGERSSQAAKLLKQAALLEESADMCLRGKAEIHLAKFGCRVYDRYDPVRGGICIRVEDHAHIIISGKLTEFGLKGGCSAENWVCLDRHHKDHPERFVELLTGKPHPIGAFLASIASNALRAAAGSVAALPQIARLQSR